MNKPTPGPWAVTRTSREPGPRARFEVHTPAAPYDGKPFGDWVAGDMAEADAHLVAAAPDMLTALEGLWRRVDRSPDGNIFVRHDEAVFLAALITRAGGIA
jgi:hypothetical protein